MKDWMQISQRLIMLGQLGLSLLMPLLMCLGGCYLLVTRVGLGLWIYFPGFLFGLGASFMTLAYGQCQGKEEERDRAARLQSSQINSINVYTYRRHTPRKD